MSFLTTQPEELAAAAGKLSRRVGLPVVSWGLISLAFLSHTVRGRYRRSPPAESGHHSNRRQAK